MAIQEIDDITFNSSRSAFDSYAAMDGPDVPSSAGEALQVRLARWQNREFGPTPDERIALGIAEEVGELAESLEEHNTDKALDAVADICVYAMNLCTAVRLDFWSIADCTGAPTLGSPASDTSFMLYVIRATAAQGRIGHAILKASQGIRGMSDPEKMRRAVATGMQMLLSQMHCVCVHFGTSLWTQVSATAEDVMKRTWKRNPDTGGVGA